MIRNIFDYLNELRRLCCYLCINFLVLAACLTICYYSRVQISMPGMMDTVLNLGLNDDVVAGLASKSGERFAYDSYRRFLDMFGNVVCDFLPFLLHFKFLFSFPAWPNDMEFVIAFTII